MAVMFWSYAFVLWYGGKLIYDGTINTATDKPYDAGTILTIMLCVVQSGFQVGQAAPIFGIIAGGTLYLHIHIFILFSFW